MIKIKLHTNGIGGMLSSFNELKRNCGSAVIVDIMDAGVIKGRFYPSYKALEDVYHHKTRIEKGDVIIQPTYNNLSVAQKEKFVCVGYVNPETHQTVQLGQSNNEKIMPILGAIVL